MGKINWPQVIVGAVLGLIMAYYAPSTATTVGGLVDKAVESVRG